MDSRLDFACRLVLVPVAGFQVLAGITKERVFPCTRSSQNRGNCFGQLERTREFVELEFEPTRSARIFPGRGNIGEQPQNFPTNHQSTLLNFRKQTRGLCNESPAKSMRDLHGKPGKRTGNAGLQP